MIKNRCGKYEHLDGYPQPETRYSCRGCKYSNDPNGYDPGCTNPDRCHQRIKTYKRDGKLTAAQQRTVANIVKKVNDTMERGIPMGAEIR